MAKVTFEFESNKDWEWISVKEKMPPLNQPVLCKGFIDDEATVFAGCWDDDMDLDRWYCFPIDWCSCCRQPKTKVTHWKKYPKY